MRKLVLVLGDQLDRYSAAFDGFEPEVDRVWMAEVAEECTYLPQHRLRIAYFLSCMRHFRNELTSRGWEVVYHELDRRPSNAHGASHVEVLGNTVRKRRPERVVVVLPGDHRVLENLCAAAENLDVELEVRPDRHFYCTPERFDDWAEGRRELTLE